MSDKATTRDGGQGSRKAEPVTARQILDSLSGPVSFAQGLIVSTLPRGALHIVQPARTPETMLKPYAKDFHREDRAAWQAILHREPARAMDCWPRNTFESSAFYHSFLMPHGLRYMAAAPLASPVLPGYPGALVLFRGPQGPEFSDDDLRQMKKACRQMDEALNKMRRARREDPGAEEDWVHQAEARFLIFDQDARPVYPGATTGLRDRLDQQVRQYAREALDRARHGYAMADRVLLPDATGDLWVFRVVVNNTYPALGEGPFAFFCLQPGSWEWVNVRPADLTADPELVRLLPTLRFMHQDFHRNPTLDEIAKRAHLSPFHFHRRFTELLGQTPKHFLLSCQIHEAKRLLAARARELADIATDCGFAHQSHFTSRFKQATGLTPTRWRRVAVDSRDAAVN